MKEKGKSEKEIVLRRSPKWFTQAQKEFAMSVIKKSYEMGSKPERCEFIRKSFAEKFGGEFEARSVHPKIEQPFDEKLAAIEKGEPFIVYTRTYEPANNCTVWKL